MGTVTERMRLTNAGHLGIGAVDPHSQLTVGGRVAPAVDNAHTLGSAAHRWESVYASGGVIQSSDVRLKTDVRDCPLGLDFVLSLRPKLFRWIEGATLVEERIQTAEEHEAGEAPEPAQALHSFAPRPGRRLHTGLLAQDVRAALDAAEIDCGIWTIADPADTKSRQSLRYVQLIARSFRRSVSLRRGCTTLS